MSKQKVVSIYVEGIMGVKKAKLIPDGSLLQIGGYNEQGKTSFMRGFEMALRGRRFFPQEAINKEVDTGKVEIELTDFTIDLALSEEKDKLKVTPKGDPSYELKQRCKNQPQTILNALYDERTIDPQEFAKMDQAEQTETLMRLVGLDFKEHDAERQEAYDERRLINRDLAAAKATFEGTTFHKDAPDEEVSISGLVDRLNEVQTFNAENKSGRVELAEIINDVSIAEELCASLERQLKAAKENRSKRLDKIETFKEIPKDIDIEPIKSNISEAESINQKVRDNKEHEEKKVSFESLKVKSEKHTANLDKMDKKKFDDIAAAEMPIDGLGLEDSGVTFNDLPFSQASDGATLRTSVAMGLKMNPDLPIVLIRNGSLLDKKNRAMIGAMCKEAEALCLMEVVGEDEECAIIFENGMVKEGSR